MSSFLLIVLILLLTVNVSFTQIITISQKGLEIIQPTRNDSQTVFASLKHKVVRTNNKFDSFQTSWAQKEGRY